MASELKQSYQKRGVNNDRLQVVLAAAGQSILDVGCGSGAYVLKLADKYAIRGVDYQPFESWDEAPELFEVSDATKLRFEDDSFDTLLSFETLEHLPDPAAALREYYRVCRNNVILTVPNCAITDGMKKSNMLYSHWIDRTHVNFFDIESISALVADAGFKVVKQTYINKISVLPLITEAFGLNSTAQRWASRLLKRFQKRHHYITCIIIGEKIR
jgi:ubiquinone/menaquinone biosynthesis C-methylase UbiE